MEEKTMVKYMNFICSKTSKGPAKCRPFFGKCLGKALGKCPWYWPGTLNALGKARERTVSSLVCLANCLGPSLAIGLVRPLASALGKAREHTVH